MLFFRLPEETSNTWRRAFQHLKIWLVLEKLRGCRFKFINHAVQYLPCISFKSTLSFLAYIWEIEVSHADALLQGSWCSVCSLKLCLLILKSGVLFQISNAAIILYSYLIKFASLGSVDHNLEDFIWFFGFLVEVAKHVEFELESCSSWSHNSILHFLSSFSFVTVSYVVSYHANSQGAYSLKPPPWFSCKNNAFLKK